MTSITPELTEELLEHFVDEKTVGSKEAFPVKNFRDLVEQNARLSFKNKNHLLFYRGQTNDYKNKAGSSTFYPTIYREEYLHFSELVNSFEILEGASNSLINLFKTQKIEGYKELIHRKSIQWSILQHYDVCNTPLLDFTHSLRVACSFALTDNDLAFGYVSFFGLPYITNRISVNSEQEIVNVRLLSICPPTALRPYFQEGYLAGTEEVTTLYEKKTDLDFNNRLIAKFAIPNDDKFWGQGFNKIPKKSLYPDDDPIFDLTREIKEISLKQLQPGDIGEFLKSWAGMEERLITSARNLTNRNVTLREAIRIQYERGLISEDSLHPLDQLRVFRNTLVHNPMKIDQKQINWAIQLLKDTKDRLYHSSLS